MTENTTLGDMVFEISEKYNLHLGVARNIVHGYALEIIAAAFNANANLNDFMNALTTETPAVPAAKAITFGMVDEYRPMGANKIERAALWYDGKEYKQKTFDTRKEAIEFLKSINVPYKTRSEYCALKAQNS